MELIRVFAFVVKLAIALALVGELKTCTLELLGSAATSSDHGMISYGKFTRLLNQTGGGKNHD
jgi:hypothetical protein